MYAELTGNDHLWPRREQQSSRKREQKAEKKLLQVQKQHPYSHYALNQQVKLTPDTKTMVKEEGPYSCKKSVFPPSKNLNHSQSSRILQEVPRQGYINKSVASPFSKSAN